MVKTKEDRSGWVAVQPEFSSPGGGSSSAASAPAIRPPSTAYQIYQRENSSAIKDDLIRSGQPSDLGHLTRAISSRWRGLDPVRRARYEEMARDDAARFMAESHRRDVEVMRERERRVRERETLIIDDGDGGGGGGGRTTRGNRARQMKKNERAERRRAKEERKMMRREMKKQRSFHSDDDELHSDEESSEEDSDESYSEGGSDDADGSGSGSGSGGSYSGETDSDEGGGRKKKKAKKAPKKKRSPPPPPKRQPSQAVVAARARARADRDAKEAYVAERREDLLRDKASQAKRRLEFLLKQSDIFSHFGKVKEDQAKFGIRSVKRSASSVSGSGGGSGGGGGSEGGATHRAVAGQDVDEEAELADADEHEASFLTEQPSTLGGDGATMRQYQLEGLNWMIRLQEHGVNGILADEMGLGKTLQSISMLVFMHEYRNCDGPHLIVVPKSTLSNWMNELKRWAPSLTSIKFHGTKEERENLANDVLCPGQRDEYRQWNVCVTTYECCNNDRNVFNKFAWSYLIIDEAHRLKNEASLFSRTIRTFETRYRLLLTGTPLQNNLHELWALLNFLVPDVFASAEQFDEWFNLDIDDADEKNKLISQLHKILRPFMLRRLKVDVETSLPPKHETILFTGMSAMQKKLYKEILLRDIEVLQGKGGAGSGSRTAILNIVMQLRKCAGHPYLFPGVEDRSLPPLGEHLVSNCGKLVLLDKLLLRLQQRGHRVLLFTQMTRILDILEDYMVMRRFKYCRIDGNTSYDEREERIDSFNAPDSEKFLFLLSTRAGGLGINLQTADIVILYDSDWNPQADLQAQDRAHRIGQKREVQVFRLVTEHTVEEKVVERAQQKLKLDAMVVQQGRLKDKDKQLSREDLLEAVRFGADKVFKSKDSSITDDDIDLILEAGKRKTQELNEKLQMAEKGDMLDFKLDGSTTNLQTFEGVDYSGSGAALAQAKAEQAQAELLGILDMGKRERRKVGYNENQLYQSQIAAHQGSSSSRSKKKRKETRLPKYLRLPRMEEWQMFDRDALHAIQEEEEAAFRALPEEVQKAAIRGRLGVGGGGAGAGAAPPAAEKESAAEEEPAKGEGGGEGGAPPAAGAERPPEPPKEGGGEEGGGDAAAAAEEGAGGPGPGASAAVPTELPPLLSDERRAEKRRLLAEGFADWHKHHYAAFVRASSMFGRDRCDKIAAEVGKPLSAVEAYASAFWDENVGRARMSHHEYDRAVKSVERGERKLEEVKWLQRGTRVLLSLFENPWTELEFTHVNCRDKMFTAEEDRHLLCWAHKYGYGQWDAVKMAIRRSPSFRFDYYLRSLPAEVIGKRCEQLMKAAGREVEQMEKEALEEAGKEKKADANDGSEEEEIAPVKLPMFRVMQANKRAKAEDDLAVERRQLEEKVEEIESHIEEVQRRLKELQEYSKEGVRNFVHSAEMSEELVPELANLVARSGPAGIMTIANEFASRYPGQITKKQICSKIDEIAKREKRVDEGDTKQVWYVQPDYMHLLDVETLRYLRKTKEERLEKEEGRKKGAGQKRKEAVGVGEEGGAIGPDGDVVPFPDYDGSEPPRENKKAFTLFCNGTRREVKASLDSASRKDKKKVNSLLKERWYGLSDEEKQVWKKWQVWDEKRYQYQLKVFEQAEKERSKGGKHGSSPKPHVDNEPEKNVQERSDNANVAAAGAGHIPKKKRRHIDSASPEFGRETSHSSSSSIPKKKRAY